MVPVDSEEQETDELRDFRENWKKEVQERKKQQQQQSLQDSADPSTAPSNQPSTSEDTGAPQRTGVLRLRDDALGVYTRAVKHEQAGELDDALRLYRQAFRMDPNVDRAHHLKEGITARTLETTALPAAPPEQNVEKKVAVSVRPGSDDATAPRVVHAKLPSSAHHLDRQTSGLLAAIVANFPKPLSFEPEDERAVSPLRRLPDELLVHVLSYLGVAAIEQFARVSRKARVITLDATVWRSDIYFCKAQRRSFQFRNLFLSNGVFRALFVTHGRNSSHCASLSRAFVEAICKPPQISPDEVLDDIVDKHSSDYRRVYIERPRVRLDGVYIAVCHYM